MPVLEMNSELIMAFSFSVLSAVHAQELAGRLVIGFCRLQQAHLGLELAGGGNHADHGLHRVHVRAFDGAGQQRSEEHTSELQSPCNLVCRLLLEKKKKKISSSGLDYLRLPRDGRVTTLYQSRPCGAH